MKKDYLWSGIQLPAWNSNALFAAFGQVQQGANDEKVRDVYCRQLMVLISAHMGRCKWITGLRKRHIDPEEAAADVLWHIFHKTPKIRLKTPCVLVLLQVLRRAIFNRLVSIIRQHDEQPTEIAASQIGLDAEEGWERMEVPVQEQFSLTRLVSYLEEIEESVCDVPDDGFYVRQMYHLLCDQIVSKNTVLAHAQMPIDLKRRISLETHAHVAYRLNKAIRDYAAG